MTDAMHLELVQYQGRVPVTVLRIVGEINVSTCEQLQTEADRSVEAAIHNLVLDLSQVTYISSAGLRAIHAISKALSAAGAAGESPGGTLKSSHLKLLNPTPAVRKTLNMTGFELFLEIHNDLDEAVTSF